MRKQTNGINLGVCHLLSTLFFIHVSWIPINVAVLLIRLILLHGTFLFKAIPFLIHA